MRSMYIISLYRYSIYSYTQLDVIKNEGHCLTFVVKPTVWKLVVEDVMRERVFVLHKDIVQRPV